MTSPPGVSRVGTFFVLTLAITWVSQLPAALAKRGLIDVPFEPLMPLGMLGVFAPAVVGLVLARREPGGARAVLQPLLRANAMWLAIALVLPGAILWFGLALYAGVSGYGGAWLYPPDNAQRIVALVLMSVVEEIGWRGYALPRLQARDGAIRASLLIGVVWAFWHVPMFLLTDVPLALIPLMLVLMIPGSVVFTWLWNRSGGSLLVAVFAHMGAHLNNSHRSLPADLTPLIVHTVGYCVVALVVAGDLRRRADRSVSRVLEPAAQEKVPWV